MCGGWGLQWGLFHTTNFPLNTKEEVSEMLCFSLLIMNKEEMKFNSSDGSCSVCFIGAHRGIPDVISVCMLLFKPFILMYTHIYLSLYTFYVYMRMPACMYVHHICPRRKSLWSQGSSCPLRMLGTGLESSAPAVDALRCCISITTLSVSLDLKRNCWTQNRAEPGFAALFV